MIDLSKAPHADMMRTPLSRARGLGAAKQGAHHWWMQRLTAVALVPLTFWFIFSIIRLQGATQEDIVDWLSRPRRLVFMCSLIVCTFYHLMLGLQIVIEDYIHNPAGKMAANLANKAGCGLLGLACLISALKLGL